MGGLRARLAASHAGDVWAFLAASVWTVLGDYPKVCLRMKSSAPPQAPLRPCASGSASGTSVFSSLTPFSFRLFSLRIIVTTSTAQDHHTPTAGSQSGRSGRSGGGSGGRGIFGRAFLLLYSIAWRSLDNSWVVRKVGEIILKSILVGTRGRQGGPGAAQTERRGQHHHEALKTRRGCG